MMNKVELIGRITKDLELRYTQSQKPVLSFSIAVNKRVNGENSADFISCVAWNTTAEFISRYFKKGQEIAIVGRLQNRSYDDKGQKKYVTEVVVEETEFVGSKAKVEGNPEEKAIDGMYENYNYDDEMPF